MGEAPSPHVTVMYSPAPRQVREWTLALVPGATVGQVLQASPIGAEYPQLDLRRAALGIWGRKARPDQLPRDGDRIEVYRALRVDPKLARRERFKKQGTRGAGLFAAKKKR